MRANKTLALALIAGLTLAAGVRVSAHRLDEFLQATRVLIESDRVELELSLTPGMALADGIIGEIDSNKDGVFSETERLEYASEVLNDLSLRVDDGTPLRLTLKDSSFPDPASMRTGDSAIVLQSEAGISPLASGGHRLVFRNSHAPETGVYLANALVPNDDAIAVTGQERDANQKELTIEFLVSTSPRYWTWAGLASMLTLAVCWLRPTRTRGLLHAKRQQRVAA